MAIIPQCQAVTAFAVTEGGLSAPCGGTSPKGRGKCGSLTMTNCQCTYESRSPKAKFVIVNQTEAGGNPFWASAGLLRVTALPDANFPSLPGPWAPPGGSAGGGWAAGKADALPALSPAFSPEGASPLHLVIFPPFFFLHLVFRPFFHFGRAMMEIGRAHV